MKKWLFLLLVVGCRAADAPPGLNCTPRQSPGVDPAKTVTYDKSHLLCVKVTMNADDFDALSREGRDAFSVSNTPCHLPFVSPFQNYHADIVVDGVALSDVAIRQKGFVGSLNPQKPSLKIKTDKFVEGQELGDTERITLNNNSREISRVRTCLSYNVFERAGYPAPRCNLAVVVVNDVPMGVYTHIEPIKKRFLKYAFGNKSGSLYEATLTDFRSDWLARFEAKTGNTDEAFTGVHNIIAALDIADDDDFLQVLGEVINIDHFLTFWALEIILGHADGYSGNVNNYFLYFDPDDGGLATFIPWSADLTLATSDGSPFSGDDLATFTRARIPSRFSRMPAMASRLEDEVLRVLDLVWDEDALIDEVDAMAALARLGQDDPNHDAAVSELRAVIRGRDALVREQIEAGLPVAATDDDLCQPALGG